MITLESFPSQRTKIKRNDFPSQKDYIDREDFPSQKKAEEMPDYLKAGMELRSDTGADVETAYLPIEAEGTEFFKGNKTWNRFSLSWFSG